MLIGFHERKSSYVADMTSCAVLPRKISDLLPELRALIGGLSVRDRLPQIELAVGDGAQSRRMCWCCAFSSRSPPEDEAALRAFAEAHGVQFCLQPGGPATATPFRPRAPPLAYALPEFDLSVPVFAHRVHAGQPRDQPRARAARGGARSTRSPGERIADFFCGIGNFTLPIARRGAMVIGVEGSAALVRARRGERRAQRACRRTPRFASANLFAATPESLEALGPLDKIADRSAARRRDRARQGAAAATAAPRRIVYVSCNPATLARDASVLVHDHGYRSRGGGRGQHVSAHVARRVDRAVRALKSGGNNKRQAPKTRGDLRRPDATAKARAFSVSRAARKRQQQVEQADEDVVHVEEQAQRGHHVVRLAAAHDVA